MCWPGCMRRSASWPRCTSARLPGSAVSSARPCWRRSLERMHSRALAGRSRGRFRWLLAVATEGQWRGCAAVVGIDPADGRFAENQLRVGRRDELIAEIEQVLARGDRAHWLALFAQAGV